MESRPRSTAGVLPSPTRMNGQAAERMSTATRIAAKMRRSVVESIGKSSAMPTSSSTTSVRRTNWPMVMR